MRRAIALVIAFGAALLAAPSAHAAVREYWVAAVDVDWNMVPNGRDAIEHMMYDAS